MWVYKKEERKVMRCICTRKRKMWSGKEVASAIRPLINVRGLQVECVRVLHEELIIPLLLYNRETMIWREKERSRITGVQMDLRGLLGMKRMDRVLNAWIRE